MVFAWVSKTYGKNNGLSTFFSASSTKNKWSRWGNFREIRQSGDNALRPGSLTSLGAASDKVKSGVNVLNQLW